MYLQKLNSVDMIINNWYHCNSWNIQADLMWIKAQYVAPTIQQYHGLQKLTWSPQLCVLAHVQTQLIFNERRQRLDGCWYGLCEMVALATSCLCRLIGAFVLPFGQTICTDTKSSRSLTLSGQYTGPLSICFILTSLIQFKVTHLRVWGSKI